MSNLGGEGSEARFEAYVEALIGVIGHADRAVPLRDYCVGLTAPLERKSVEPMAAATAPARTSAQHQSLLHFVGKAPWSASRPTMRFVAVKTEAQQARAMLFRTRDLLVRQRTQLINALRGHLAEHGVVAARGPAQIKRLADAILEGALSLPSDVRDMGQLYLEQIATLDAKVTQLDKRLRAAAGESETARRLQSLPGVGPVTAIALETFAPAMQSFRRGRDFAAWLGLTPLQRSTGGKQRLGRTSKMGQRDIRRLLITGAMSVIIWKGRGGGRPGSWLARMLAKKPRMLVAIALANKMARMIWAMITRNENYRDPAGAVC